MLADLKEGQKIRVTKRVGAGLDAWTTEIVGTYVGRERRPTGIHTDRVPEDDIYVATIRLDKDNGERTAIVVDEFTQIAPAD